MRTPNVLWLKSLTDRELATWAELDPRYNTDPMYTELVLRIARAHAAREHGTGARTEPALLDARS